jgi:DnaJ-class molecular chaperone
MKIQDIQKEQKDKPCWNCKYFKGAYLEGVTFDCEVLGDNQLWSYIDNCEHFKHRGGEMKVIKKYPIVCLSCYGKGHIPNDDYSSNATKICPACKGTGMVEVIEEIEKEDK